VTVAPFTRLTSVAAPLPIDNVETDVIIPARLCVRPAGADYADTLFAPWRYQADGTENAAFVLNCEPYRRAQILLTGANFGYGSSREHAAYALRDFGIRAIVASSFAAIFAANCLRNGVLPVTLEPGALRSIVAEAELAPRAVTIDLRRQVVAAPSGREYGFEIAPLEKQLLLEGLDSIELVLRHELDVAAFQDRDKERRPWVYL
jgi:3-isopropylmalate/(R)-2-methylmalate dehydratase small subunit